MSFSIRAIELLKWGRFPKFQECRESLQPFNPYALNLFVSHKWISKEQADDGRYFRHFICCLLRIVNRCCNEKFLDDDRAGMNRMFNAEYIFDRSMGFDLYRHILVPSEEDLSLIEPYLDAEKLSEQCIKDILAYLSDINVWFDWTCVPQLPRTDEEEILFKTSLKNMHWVLENSYTVCLWEGDEFYRGWCIIEVLIARTVQTLMFYKIEDYDTKAHQRDQSKKMDLFSQLMGNLGLSGAASADDPTKELPNYFDYGRRAPPFIHALEVASDRTTVKTIFDNNSIRCSYTEDIDKVIDIYVRYREKYQGFERYQPIYMTRVPADFRSKLVNSMRNLYEGGIKLFSPVLFEYVNFPATQWSQALYEQFVVSSISEPFYNDFTVVFYPRVIDTQDPVKLLHTFYFDVPDMSGVVFNRDVHITDKDPIEDGELAPIREFPCVRIDYDYSLGMIHPDTRRQLGRIKTLIVNGEEVERKAVRGGAKAKSCCVLM